jgi:hypothetical protein
MNHSTGMHVQSSVLPTVFKQKLMPYHNKPPHLYELPKIQRPEIPSRATVAHPVMILLVLFSGY